MNKSMFEISKNTRLVYQLLASLAEGEEVKYAELSAIVGGDIQRGARHNLTSAREKAERDDGIVTECIPKVGIKRVARKDLASVGESAISRARNTARHGAMSVLRGVEKTPPTGEDLTRAMVLASVASTIAEMGGSKRIEAAVKAAGNKAKEMSFTDTLKLFEKK